MHFVLLSTNFLESVIDSKIEYLIVLPMSYFPVQLSTDFRHCLGLGTTTRVFSHLRDRDSSTPTANNNAQAPDAKARPRCCANSSTTAGGGAGTCSNGRSRHCLS